VCGVPMLEITSNGVFPKVKGGHRIEAKGKHVAVCKGEKFKLAWLLLLAPHLIIHFPSRIFALQYGAISVQLICHAHAARRGHPPDVPINT